MDSPIPHPSSRLRLKDFIEHCLEIEDFLLCMDVLSTLTVKLLCFSELSTPFPPLQEGA